MSYEDRQSTCNSGVWKSNRRRLAEGEVRKHWDRVPGAWKQISKQRRRVDVSYDPSMVTALQYGTGMDDEGFKKTCIEEKKEGLHQEITLVCVCRIRIRLYVIMTLNDIYMSNNF